ncbi:MAG TPA: glycosyltransferase [Candidatus Saccharimonadales bacterium]|nr:glycosyltransferase [Candidatus Saccharimonadales bacterium]
MKILFVSESYWPNLDGGALFERRLAQGLIKRGHHVAVWAPAKNLRGHQEQDGDSLIYREPAVPLLDRPYYKVSLWPFGHAFRIIRRERPDLIHIHNPTQIGLAALIAARYYHVPVMATNHAMPQNFLSPSLPSWLYNALVGLFWRYIAWFHNRMDFVATPTPIALSYLKKYGLRRPSAAITNGLDLDHYNPGPAPHNHPPFLLYVGRLDSEKNLQLLIQAVALLKPTTSLRLELIGGGNQQNTLIQATNELGLTDIITFRGRVSEEDKLAAYRQADVFVITSPAELQSIVTMEAMACAKPVVAVDAGALPNLVRDGVNGYLVPPNDAELLAQRCRQLLNSASLRQRFGKASLETIRTHHATDVTFDAYERTYRQVLKENRAR